MRVTGTTEQSRHLPAGRKAQLAAYVADAGQVAVGVLAEQFGVSIDTIRRDLDQLDAEGSLVRTYGGAISLALHSGNDRAVDVRMSIQAAEKEKIGSLAASLVQDGSVIMLNGGTTVLALARHLRNQRNLTVATNNLLVPSELSPAVFRDLYVLGGAVRTVTQATTGPVSLRVSTGGDELDIRFDLALIAVGAVSTSGGYSTSNLAEAAMMAEMISRSSRVAILADSSKFERQLFARVADLGAVDYFVTDTAPPPELSDAFEQDGVTVITPETSVAKAS